MTVTDKNTQTFCSLADIRARKDQLRNEIYADEEKISSLWSDLFYKKESQEPATPVQRMSNMINMGAGLIDGIILGWKIYRKFRATVLYYSKRRDVNCHTIVCKIYTGRKHGRSLCI